MIKHSLSNEVEYSLYVKHLYITNNTHSYHYEKKIDRSSLYFPFDRFFGRNDNFAFI